MVFCGLFPTDADDFNDLREALGRLQLNDAALSYEPEASLRESLYDMCEAVFMGVTKESFNQGYMMRAK